MKEVLEAMFKSSKERIRNPLIFSFIISWIIYNWNWILIMFYSKLTIEEKIDIVKPIDGILWSLGFWYPLFFAFIYTLVLPYLLILVDNLTNHSFDGRKRASSDRRLIELKYSLKVVAAEVMLERERTEHKDISELNKQVKSAKERNAELLTEINNSNEKLLENEEEIKQLKQRIVELEAKSITDSATQKTDLSQAERARMRNRFSWDVKATIQKVMIEMANHYYSALDKSEGNVATKFLSSLDEIRPLIQDISDKYAKYEDVKLLEVYDEVVKLIDELEDNIDDIAKIITADHNQKSKVDESLRIIFTPVLSALTQN